MKSTPDAFDPAVPGPVTNPGRVAREPAPTVETSESGRAVDAPDAPPVRPVGNTDGAPPSNAYANQAPPARWLGRSIPIVVFLLAGGLMVFAAGEWNWWVGSAIEQSTDDAYLRADATPLAAKSAGYVRRVPVTDFQKVKAGELLVEIVDDDYRAALEQAQANVDAAHAAIGISLCGPDLSSTRGRHAGRAEQ